MASTRNKNMPGNYALEHRQRTNIDQWHQYQYGSSGHVFQPQMPGIGLTPGFMGADVLSSNPTDIESHLFGIQANNLVTPQAVLVPQLKSLEPVHLFTLPRIVMPTPLNDTYVSQQRPFPI